MSIGGSSRNQRLPLIKTSLAEELHWCTSLQQADDPEWEPPLLAAKWGSKANGAGKQL